MDYKYRFNICIGIVLISVGIINGIHQAGSISAYITILLGAGSVFYGLGGLPKTKG